MRAKGPTHVSEENASSRWGKRRPGCGGRISDQNPSSPNGLLYSESSFNRLLEPFLRFILQVKAPVEMAKEDTVDRDLLYKLRTRLNLSDVVADKYAVKVLCIMPG